MRCNVSPGLSMARESLSATFFRRTRSYEPVESYSDRVLRRELMRLSIAISLVEGTGNEPILLEVVK